VKIQIANPKKTWQMVASGANNTSTCLFEKQGLEKYLLDKKIQDGERKYY